MNAEQRKQRQQAIEALKKAKEREKAEGIKAVYIPKGYSPQEPRTKLDTFQKVGRMHDKGLSALDISERLRIGERYTKTLIKRWQYLKNEND